MKKKAQEIYDRYVAKLKELMEYQALVTLPFAIANALPGVKERMTVVIDYTKFSPVPMEALNVNMKNIDETWAHMEKKYLAETCIERLVAIYELYLFDLMKAVYTEYPLKLSSKKQITVGQALTATNKEELLYLVIANELNEIKYQSMDNWHEHLAKLFGIQQIPETLSDTLIELKASRDLIVHNESIINEIYLSKSKKVARGKIGERIDCSGGYFQQSWVHILNALKVTNDEIASKYA